MHHGILSTIGNTPIVHLSQIFPCASQNIFAKLEQLNPGGSIKDRTALMIVNDGLDNGSINFNTTIIESSSGNMGIGLAQVCAFHGLRFVCVIDPKTTAQNVSLLRAYGAQIELVETPDPETGEFLPQRIKRVRQLIVEIPGSVWPNQYASQSNVKAHYQTMREIMVGADNKVDYLFCATSTCGTLRGCVEYRNQNSLSTRIVAVDAVGSAIFGGPIGPRLIPGHGAGIIPDLYYRGLEDEVINVSDLESIYGCRLLLRKEAILAGGSSGAVIAALERKLPDISENANCVVILPDRGERYLETIYSDDWVNNHFKIEDCAHMETSYACQG